MYIVIIIILVIIITILEKKLNNTNMNEKNVNNKNINLSKYIKKDYVMTQSELKFYRELKKITDELEMVIFPQVNLERIVNVIDNNNTDRNKIKSRSIDFTIVNNNNCKIICCIELDDYTHKYENRIKRDEFINELFNNVGIKLHRIRVQNYYNLEEIKKIITDNN